MWLIAYVLWILCLWTSFLWNYVFMELRFYEWQSKFLWQVFKVSYQSSDLREVMFRLKGTVSMRLWVILDGRSLWFPFVCAHWYGTGPTWTNLISFLKNEFLRNNWWICVMLLSLWMCIFYTTTLVLAEQKLTLYVRVTGNKGKQPVNSQ